MEPSKIPVQTLSGVVARPVEAGRVGVSADGTAHVWNPAVDVKETETEFVVFADLPGVDEDDIQIRFDGGVFSVAVTRDFDHDAEDAEEYTRLDRPYGRFEACVPLSKDAEFDLASAKYRRGVLKVRVPKRRA